MTATLDTPVIATLPRFSISRNDGVEGEGRTYDTPEGRRASVTTILSRTRDESGLQDWRESIGEEKADLIRDIGAFRGTRMHDWAERYLLHQEEPEFCFLTTPYWNSIHKVVSRMRSSVVTEAPVWHPDGFAGALDYIGYYTGDTDQPSLHDWKSADKPYNATKVYECSLQLAAYRKGANYVYAPYGLNIKRAHLHIGIWNDQPISHTLEEDQLDQLYLHFLARIRHFTHRR